MDPLQALLAPVTRLVNRRIATVTPARELCRELAGKVVAVRVRNTGLVACFRVEADGIAMLDDFDGEPDAAVTGSLLTLARLAGESGDAAVREGALELTGDADVARRFQKLLFYGRPDLEEELSAIVGDVVAHEVGELARHLGRWGHEARRTLRRNLSEYLQEEARVLPTRYEVNAFRERVETLRDDVARLEARLGLLENRLTSG
ncbi:MAG TPA: SCP2 sterol-binding domain-containing protein [Woeseiaceae bacterium]|nr:SCP2 sterol-binding domain-containing protein [Woeseiaceae bacterium]